MAAPKRAAGFLCIDVQDWQIHKQSNHDFTRDIFPLQHQSKQCNKQLGTKQIADFLR